jgi:hypothetical protein
MLKITYLDNTIFTSNNPLNSNWNEQPTKLITQIEYSLFGINYSFKGFKRYNHLKFKVELPQYNKLVYTNIQLIGEGTNTFTVLNYNLLKKTATIKILPLTNDISKSSGWKEGIVEGNEFFERIK